MKGCIANGCSNTCNTPGKSLHRFPKDCMRRKEWIRRISKKNLNPTNSTYVCSDHFTPDSFKYDAALLRRLDHSFRCRRLRQDAIPTLFPDMCQKTAQRKAKQENLEVRNYVMFYCRIICSWVTGTFWSMTSINKFFWHTSFKQIIKLDDQNQDLSFLISSKWLKYGFIVNSVMPKRILHNITVISFLVNCFLYR